MNAKEARELATRILCDENDKTYKAIKEGIESAARNKEYSFSYGDIIHPLIKARLEEEEFVIKFTSDQREGSYTTISW